MNNRNPGSLRKQLSVSLIIAAFSLLYAAGCNRSGSDQQLSIFQAQAKMLILTEAQQGFKDLFKATFDPDKTQLLVGGELNKWAREHPSAMRNVPAEIAQSINGDQGMALLISGGLHGKGGSTHDVVYMRPSRFGIRRWFAVVDPDPCGDGNPATCEFCSGCSGGSEPGGILHSCVCTMSCDDCHPCSPCG